MILPENIHVSNIQAEEETEEVIFRNHMHVCIHAYIQYECSNLQIDKIHTF